MRKQAGKTFSHSLHFDSLAKCLARGKQSYKLHLLFRSPSPSFKNFFQPKNSLERGNQSEPLVSFSFFSSFSLFPGSFNRQRPSIHPSTFDGRLSLVRPRKSLQILGIIVIAGSRLIKACTR